MQSWKYEFTIKNDVRHAYINIGRYYIGIGRHVKYLYLERSRSDLQLQEYVITSSLPDFGLVASLLHQNST